MVTVGQRRLGRKIRKLENSVELSSKEKRAKESEIIYREKTRSAFGIPNDYPVQDLKSFSSKRKKNQE